jgi:hypothetical protein
MARREIYHRQLRQELSWAHLMGLVQPSPMSTGPEERRKKRKKRQQASQSRARNRK